MFDEEEGICGLLSRWIFLIHSVNTRAFLIFTAVFRKSLAKLVFG
jgi:hypothetical protein